jgi:hypothetical protein
MRSVLVMPSEAIVGGLQLKARRADVRTGTATARGGTQSSAVSVVLRRSRKRALGRPRFGSGFFRGSAAKTRGWTRTSSAAGQALRPPLDAGQRVRAAFLLPAGLTRLLAGASLLRCPLAGALGAALAAVASGGSTQKPTHVHKDLVDGTEIVRRKCQAIFLHDAATLPRTQEARSEYWLDVCAAMSDSRDGRALLGDGKTAARSPTHRLRPFGATRGSKAGTRKAAGIQAAGLGRWDRDRSKFNSLSREDLHRETPAATGA